MAVRVAVSLLGLALASQACSKGSKVDETPAPESGPNDATSNAQPDTTRAGGSVTAGAGGGASMSTDPAVVKLGEDIFHGRKASGSCYACHGPKGNGAGVAP